MEMQCPVSGGLHEPGLSLGEGLLLQERGRASGDSKQLCHRRFGYLLLWYKVCIGQWFQMPPSAPHRLDSHLCALSQGCLCDPEARAEVEVCCFQD